MSRPTIPLPADFTVAGKKLTPIQREDALRAMWAVLAGKADGSNELNDLCVYLMKQAGLDLPKEAA